MTTDRSSNGGEDKAKADAEKALGIITQTLWSQKIYNEMVRDLVIFGTTHPHIYKKASLWQRFKWRILGLAERVRDAWLVLTGQAHIADDDY
jgi:hypothetical protein